jgi:hypothetical protein
MKLKLMGLASSERFDIPTDPDAVLELPCSFPYF